MCYSEIRVEVLETSLWRAPHYPDPAIGWVDVFLGMFSPCPPLRSPRYASELRYTAWFDSKRPCLGESGASRLSRLCSCLDTVCGAPARRPFPAEPAASPISPSFKDQTPCPSRTAPSV